MFGRKKKDKDKEFNLNQPATPIDQTKQQQIREMSGHATLDDVKKAAPSHESDTAQPPNARTRTARQAKQEQERTSQAQQEQKRENAMAVVGGQMMRELAEVPYSLWAFLASDPNLRLNPEDATRLAESYYILAQAYEPDFSKPFWLIPTITLMHLKLVAARLAYMTSKTTEEEKKKAVEFPKAGEKPN
jgi:hypothetical protein